MVPSVREGGDSNAMQRERETIQSMEREQGILIVHQFDIFKSFVNVVHESSECNVVL